MTGSASGRLAVTIIDNAVYVNGFRTEDPEDLDETYFLLRQRSRGITIGVTLPGWRVSVIGLI